MIGIKEEDLPWGWGKDDQRSGQWKKERNKYSFDERDTWNLNYTLTALIYERLRMYREIAPINMDSPGISHEYDVDGEIVPYGYIIDRILVSFENRLRHDRNKMSDEEMKEFEKCWKLLGKIHWSLWW